MVSPATAGSLRSLQAGTSMQTSSAARYPRRGVDELGHVHRAAVEGDLGRQAIARVLGHAERMVPCGENREGRVQLAGALGPELVLARTWPGEQGRSAAGRAFWGLDVPRCAVAHSENSAMALEIGSEPRPCWAGSS